MSTTITGPDGKSRCRRCTIAPEFLAYHVYRNQIAVSANIRSYCDLTLIVRDQIKALGLEERVVRR